MFIFISSNKNIFLIVLILVNHHNNYYNNHWDWPDLLIMLFLYLYFPLSEYAKNQCISNYVK